VPTPKNIRPGPPEGLPANCQLGHPLTWLTDGTEPNGDGAVIGACACTARREDNRTDVRNGSVPVLWRFVPGSSSRASRLCPLFPSMNRLAFALALRLFEVGAITLPYELATGRVDAGTFLARRQAAYVALLKAQAEALPVGYAERAARRKREALQASTGPVAAR
jgi:hypothetical protein